MSKPENPLDKFSIYTYHIAIFMNASQKGLEEEIADFDWEKTKTQRNTANGSCLLNSITDPFQLIQELKIQQIAPSISSEFKTSPFGTFSMRIVEPGNCMFLNKIKKLMDDQKTKAFVSAVWGVLIKFVGRTPDSDIEEDVETPVIYGILADIKSSFNQMGSTYDLSFMMTNTMGVGQLPEHANSVHLGTLVEAINISEITTLSDALQKLQTAAQNNYDKQVEISTPGTNMRKIKYSFSIDDSSGIGDFEIKRGGGVGKDNRNKEKYYFNFEQNTPIAHAITTILHDCPKLMKLIGDSKDAWRKPFHMDGKMYQILSDTYLDETEVIVSFKVALYNGSDKSIKAGDTVTVESTSHTLYEFDFYFGDNYNVDVINFDLTSNAGLLLYLGGTPRLQIENTLGYNGYEHDGTIESGENPGSKVSKNKKYDKETPYKTNEITTTGADNDILTFAAYDNRMGGSTTEYNKERTEALQSLAMYTSIDAVQKTLQIRGHGKLLAQCLDPGATFGSNQGIWLKLNIFSRDDETGQRDRYFYDGVYSIISADHIFNDGKFTQELNLMMMDFSSLPETE